MFDRLANFIQLVSYRSQLEDVTINIRMSATPVPMPKITIALFGNHERRLFMTRALAEGGY